MLIASRDAAMVAGILGGSGTHVVQIIIGIVVVAALIIFSLTYFLSRRSLGGGEPTVRRDAAHTGVGGSVVGEATLRLSRSVRTGIQTAHPRVSLERPMASAFTPFEQVLACVAATVAWSTDGNAVIGS